MMLDLRTKRNERGSEYAARCRGTEEKPCRKRVTLILPLDATSETIAGAKCPRCKQRTLR